MRWAHGRARLIRLQIVGCRGGVLLWHRTLLYEVSRVCEVVDFQVVDVQKRLLACRQRQLRLVEAVVVMCHVPQKSCMHIHQSRNGSHWQPSDVWQQPDGCARVDSRRTKRVPCHHIGWVECRSLLQGTERSSIVLQSSQTLQHGPVAYGM